MLADLQISPHALPPTFAFDLGHSSYAHVEYNIEAILYFEDTDEPFTIKLEQLHYTPFPPSHPVQAPFVKYVRDIEKYASSRLTSQEKSFSLSIKDRFSSFTPSLDVTMQGSEMPVATVGTTFPLFVCTELSNNLSDHYAISIPEVRMRIKSLRLTKVTTYRAIRVDGWSSRPEMEETHAESVPLDAYRSMRSRTQESSNRGSATRSSSPAMRHLRRRRIGDTCPGFWTLSINYPCGLEAMVEVGIC